MRGKRLPIYYVSVAEGPCLIWFDRARDAEFQNLAFGHSDKCETILGNIAFEAVVWR